MAIFTASVFIQPCLKSPRQALSNLQPQRKLTPQCQPFDFLYQGSANYGSKDIRGPLPISVWPMNHEGALHFLTVGKKIKRRRIFQDTGKLHAIQFQCPLTKFSGNTVVPLFTYCLWLLFHCISWVEFANPCSGHTPPPPLYLSVSSCIHSKMQLKIRSWKMSLILP